MTLIGAGLLCACSLAAQTSEQQKVSLQIQELTQAMGRTQAQLEESQRQLDTMRRQLDVLQQEMQQAGTKPAESNTPAESVSSASSQDVHATTTDATALQALQEQQAMQEAQINTHEQTKVESDSKYPVKLTGLLLFNSFVNTRAVDMPATPTAALPGSGTTGASVRQTVLGFDALGPHLFGARSSADLRIDFEGTSQSNSTSGYAGPDAGAGLVRLRTAHAALIWDNTEAYFSLDRPIVSPEVPTSLTAIAEPALAWSGDLWTWNPQLGVTQNVHLGQAHVLRLQAALIDAGDAPQMPVQPAITYNTPPTASERSRLPGSEARVALYGAGTDETANHIGLGGYFSKHSGTPYHYDAWAATVDTRLHLPFRLQLSGNAYRGAALGGLGGGVYKDLIARESSSGIYHFRPLDDVGGWAQLKETFSERWQANAAFGTDNAFSHELRRYSVGTPGVYQNLAKNSTFTGNVIFSPSSYLLFSVEFRHLTTAPVTGFSTYSNIIGLAAGYKF